MYQLKISSTKPVIRYVVSVKSSNAAPLYESTYDYEYTGQNKISFKIPDYPQDDIQIIFSSDKDAQTQIIVEAYIESEEKDTLLLEKISMDYGTEEESL